MYVALYRKYRPRVFRQVIGQDIAIKILTNSILNNTFSHSYLFTGTRGTGKTTVARIFAKSLNCLNRKDFEPCDTCSNCLAMNNGSFPDCIEIDAASNRGINEIKQIRENLKLVPLKGKYKVYIIDEVHMLTIEAFNALLKSLEEPPNFVIFILATTDIHKVPITIQSRCQKIEFKRVHHDVIFQHLKNICKIEGINIEDEALKYISKAANGSVRDSLSLLEQIRNLSSKIKLQDVLEMFSIVSFQWIYDYILLLIQPDMRKLIELLNKVKYYSVNLFQFLYIALDEVKNCIYYKYTLDSSEYSSLQIENYRKILSLSNINVLNRLLSFIQNMLSYYKNDNDYILFEVNTLKFAIENLKNLQNELKDFQIESKSVQENIQELKGIQESKGLQTDNIENIKIANLSGSYLDTLDKEKQKEEIKAEGIKEEIKAEVNEEIKAPNLTKLETIEKEDKFSISESLKDVKEKVLKIFENEKLIYNVIKNAQKVFIENNKLVFVFKIEKKADITYKKIIEQKMEYILKKISEIFPIELVEVKETKGEKILKPSKNSLIDRIIDYTDRI